MDGYVYNYVAYLCMGAYTYMNVLHSMYIHTADLYHTTVGVSIGSSWSPYYIGTTLLLRSSDYVNRNTICAAKGGYVFLMQGSITGYSVTH